MVRLLLLLSTILTLSGCQRAFFAALNAGVTAPVHSAAYGDDPHQRLDVYETAQPAAPVAVFLYGGRWQNGRRQDYAFVARALTARGILTVVPDYRRYPQVRFPDFVEDAAHAVHWARAHAHEFGGDPQRLFLIGHSAGAHIAALLATDAHYLAAVDATPQMLRGVIGIAGPYDFLPLTDDDLKDIFGPEGNWPQTQPVTFVDGDEPPFLLLHGADDRLVWPRNSVRLAARLDAAHVPVEHRVYDGLGHVRILSAMRYPHLAPTLEDIVRFLHASEAGAAAGGAR